MGPPGPPLPDDEGNVDPADANGTPCSYSLPDLWLCLAPGCGSVRCGRTCRLHALGHYHREKGPHCAVIKLSTAEVWCYQCERWLGTVQSHPLEFLRIREVGARMLGVDRPGVVGNLQGPALGNGGAVGRAIRWSAAHREYLLNPRRQEERSWSMRGDQGDGPVWLIGQPFLSQWNAFLIGNGPPPESADHASLYIPGTSPPRINPELAFLGVSFVSAHDRARFAAAYPSTGLGPVCETAIPDTEEYTVLRRFVARHRLANAEWQGDDMEGEGEWEGDDFDDEAEVMEAFQQFMGI
ncbi:hypothetical protein DFJ74DRAFT_676137 [Hyaloraphidium curvatum]|nr:hypothetical protein DFJ74DRAFT_676137 [Hyaloraphidium curvatum]